MKKDDIELPDLPPLHIAPSVEPVDYPEVAQALMDYARAAIEPYQKRIAELEAIGAGGASGQPTTSRSDEPVAYAVFSDNGNIRIWQHEPLGLPEVVPLYAAPQPAETEGWRLVPVELIDFLDAKEHHLPVEDRHVLSIMLEAAIAHSKALIKANGGHYD